VRLRQQDRAIDVSEDEVRQHEIETTCRQHLQRALRGRLDRRDRHARGRAPQHRW